MSERLEPAWTPDMLSWFRRDPEDVRLSLASGADHVSYFLKGDLANLIALANAALPDDDPIERLEDGGADPSIATTLQQILDALDSYLPPD